MSLEDLLIRFGVPGILVGSALEGDLVPLLAGVLAHLGYVALPTAFLAAAAGLVLGDCGWFVLGRRARGLLGRMRAWRRVGAGVERLAGRFGALEIALSRVVFGTRNVSMMFWGARGLPLPHFLAVDVPSAAAWAALLVELGHAGSGGASAVLGRVERAEHWLLGAVVALVTLFLARRWLARRSARPG